MSQQAPETNGTAGSIEINPCEFGQLIFEIGSLVIQLKVVFSTSDGRTIGHPYAKKLNIDQYLILYIKITSK